jgi:hypothetical protein
MLSFKNSPFYFVVFFMLSFCISFPSKGCAEAMWEQVFNDTIASNLITVITVTKPFTAMPSTKRIYSAQASLFHNLVLTKCKKIIVFDGFRLKDGLDREKYELYKQAVTKLSENDYYFANTQLVFCASWVGLAGAINEALKDVKTPFVFIHHDNFQLKKDFNLNGLIATMTLNEAIKHVCLKSSGNKKAHVEKQPKGARFVPLCRILYWSEEPHISRIDYYKKFVLPKCLFNSPEYRSHMGSTEYFLQRAFKQKISKFDLKAHKGFGTYLYGHLDDDPYIQCIDK